MQFFSHLIARPVLVGHSLTGWRLFKRVHLRLPVLQAPQIPLVRLVLVQQAGQARLQERIRAIRWLATSRAAMPEGGQQLVYHCPWA